jgi:parallel beta-helix repeat protein
VVMSINNLIEENDASGTGSGIMFLPGSTGNTVRHNQALGNVPGDDILDDNALGGNNYDNNLCEFSQIGPGLANICKLPDIAGHRNFNPSSQ